MTEAPQSGTLPWPLVVTTDSPEGTREVAARLASMGAPGDIVLLIGELGAGKTVFAQGFAEALGVAGPVTSPTFTLVRQYRCAEGAPVDTLIHADVYRTGSLGEVAELALAELVEERAIALVEWGELAAPVLGDDALEVTLTRPASQSGSLADSEGRVITLRGRGCWQARAGEIAHLLAVTSGQTSS